jgi:two-component system phosphate regulon sensor histidine kinase PhoR
VTGRVFTKLLFSFVFVLCIATAILDFSFRNIVAHSLHEEARVASLGAVQQQAALHILRRDLLTASLISLFLATLASAWIAHRIASRLRSIVEFSSRIAAGDFTARIEVASNNPSRHSNPSSANSQRSSIPCRKPL